MALKKKGEESEFGAVYVFFLFFSRIISADTAVKMTANTASIAIDVGISGITGVDVGEGLGEGVPDGLGDVVGLDVGVGVGEGEVVGVGVGEGVAD